MPTIGPISIANTNDDGHFASSFGGWDELGEAGSFAIYPGTYSGTNLQALFRFILPSAIPAGATINSATLSLYLNEYWQWTTGSDYLQIRAIKSSDAPQISTDPDEGRTQINGSTLTTAITRWPASGGLDLGAINAYKTSVNFSTVIQELVDAYGGLAAGAGINVVIGNWNLLPDDSELGFSDYSRNSGTEKASLTLEYTAAAGGPHTRKFGPTPYHLFHNPR